MTDRPDVKQRLTNAIAAQPINQIQRRAAQAARIRELNAMRGEWLKMQPRNACSCRFDGAIDDDEPTTWCAFHKDMRERIAALTQDVKIMEHTAGGLYKQIDALTQERDDLIMGRTENHAHITALIAERDVACAEILRWKQLAQQMVDSVQGKRS